MDKTFCCVCKKEYEDPPPPIVSDGDNIPEELVCGYCWAEINFSNKCTTKIIADIRARGIFANAI